MTPDNQAVALLRDIKDRVAPACQKQLFKVQMDAAEDFRSDPQLYEACKADAEKLCKDVKQGGGRVQACLVSDGRAGAPLLEFSDKSAARDQCGRGSRHVGCSGSVREGLQTQPLPNHPLPNHPFPLPAPPA